ncbi:MAG: hypothetical protein ABI912_11645 [Actinomycetota bacterium]
MSIVRRWWPVVLFVAAALVVQKALFESRYDVSGHAAGHLMSASAPFAAFALLATLLFVTPRARRDLLVLGTGAAWFGCTVLVLIGNVRVVDALVDAGKAHVSTDDLVQDAAIESAHDLANLAPWLAVVAALALTAAVWRSRQVSRRVAVAAAVLNLIFPPWVFPGAGLVVLTVARCIAHQRGSDSDGLDAARRQPGRNLENAESR